MDDRTVGPEVSSDLWCDLESVTWCGLEVTVADKAGSVARNL